MLDNKRKIKKIATVIILLAIIAIGLSGLRIQSARQYRQEQKQLAKEILVDESPDSDTTEVAQTGEEGSQEETADGSDHADDQEGVSDQPDQETAAQSKSSSDGEEDSPKSGSPENDSSDEGYSSNEKNKSVNQTTSIDQDNHSTNSSYRKNSSGSKKASSGKNTVAAGNAGKGNATKKPAVSATKKPESRATQTPSMPDDSFICSITIRCNSLINHWDALSDSVKKKVPDNGYLLEKTDVKMTSADTAFSILQKVCKAKNIPLDAEYNNLFSTEYVQGIGHLYEKEAGDMSGWLYRVNGKIPSYGASRYQLQAGDTVEWVYTYTGEWE